MLLPTSIMFKLREGLPPIADLKNAIPTSEVRPLDDTDPGNWCGMAAIGIKN